MLPCTLTENIRRSYMDLWNMIQSWKMQHATMKWHKFHLLEPQFLRVLVWVLSHFSAPSLFILSAFLCVIYFPENTCHWIECLRTLKFRWMIKSIVKEAVKLSPWFWLLSREPQELIVWMVMRAGRQQMLACLYNPNPTNKFLPQKLWGTSWHPGDGDRPNHSHMPPARPIVKKNEKKKPMTITTLFAVFCNDFMALV